MLKKVKVYQVDAFTNTPFGGNPAGVVTDASGLTQDEMQKIAREMNCSETAFVLPPTDLKADFKVRFFTPSEEVDLCGHATIATFHTLAKESKVTLNQTENTFYQETRAGVLPVSLIKKSDGSLEKVIMGQTLPKVLEINIDAEHIAKLIGLRSEDLQLNNLPIQIVSTGLPDMIVPVKNLETLEKALPNYSRLAEYQKENGFVSIHAFTFETENPDNNVHTRDFAPSVNINEESATGTANGALGAYLVLNKALPIENEKISIRVEQGYVMGRPSEIFVEILHNNGDVKDVKVGGSAVIIMEGTFFW